HRELEVHDCMGCPIRMDGITWGLITVDALDVGKFSEVELWDLQALASLSAATVGVAGRIARLSSTVELERQRADNWKALASAHEPPALLGQSPAFRMLKDEIDTVGASDLTVLLAGETGVGKELVARALHAASARAAKPLVIINCAALPETLVESELFGHVRGAFSGAVSDRRGKFELASGGTLFLDEVGELSLPIQAKLLRVLQNGQLQRLGSDREHKVDVRVIAATNRDLAAEVRSGRYRADFYHRLSVYPLMVPALRDRRQDVLLLAGNFLEQSRSRLGLGSLRLSDDARTALLGYGWPGNVRELEHAIGRSALKALAEARNRTGTVGAVRPKIVSITARHLDLPSVSSPQDSPPDLGSELAGQPLLGT
ncbi:MAG: nitric oxide reductase transcriptional regulator NorR, partial [Alcaligenaceae bacterium]